MTSRRSLIVPGRLVLRPKRLIPGAGAERLEKTQHKQRMNWCSGLTLRVRSVRAGTLSAAVLLVLAAVLAAAPGAARSEAADVAEVCAGGRFRAGIDIGHSRQWQGAISASGTPEYAFNARFAEELVAMSRRAVHSGVRLDLFIHNPGGDAVSLSERPRNAQALGAQVFLSIHHDSAQKKHLVAYTAGPGMLLHAPKIRGYSLFVSRNNPRFAESRRLATLIGRSFRAAQMTPTEHHAEDIPGERREFLDREAGLYEAPFTVLASAGIPAVLVEAGVIANRAEERDLDRPEYRARMQLALIEALAAFCAGERAQSRQ